MTQQIYAGIGLKPRKLLLLVVVFFATLPISIFINLIGGFPMISIFDFFRKVLGVTRPYTSGYYLASNIALILSCILVSLSFAFLAWAFTKK